jgi:hypothetical protein
MRGNIVFCSGGYFTWTTHTLPLACAMQAATPGTRQLLQEVCRRFADFNRRQEGVLDSAGAHSVQSFHHEQTRINRHASGAAGLPA